MEYCRDCVSQEFYMEEEGLLFALLVKHAVVQMGDSGWAAAEQAAREYALYRGQRMAFCAQKVDLSPSPALFAACLDYEDHLDRMVVRPDEAGTPQVLRCGWCLGWRRYDLQQYGALYCRTMLPGMLAGFCGAACEVTAALGFGEAYCTLCLPTPDFDTVALRKAVRPLVVRDFLDHCADLYAAMQKGYAAVFGEATAAEIAKAALSEFALLRGESKARAVRIEAQNRA